MPQAIARHILVATEQEALDLKAQIERGADFAELARKHSQCPSGRDGGSLGRFAKGAMVREFDAVVFSDLPVGKTSDPVRTRFGYHILEVTQRFA